MKIQAAIIECDQRFEKLRQTTKSSSAREEAQEDKSNEETPMLQQIQTAGAYTEFKVNGTA